MIIERPGEKNDCERKIANIDIDRRWNTDLDKYSDNFEKIKGVSHSCPNCQLLQRNCICNKSLTKD